MNRTTPNAKRGRALAVWFAMITGACAPATTPAERASLKANAESRGPASVIPAGAASGANAAAGAPDADPNAEPDAVDSRALLVSDSADSTDATIQSPTWWASASGQTVSGQVFAADSGEALKGVVCTTAQCTGTGCAATALYGTPCYAKPVVDGSFAYDADSTLTLTPKSQFWFVGFNGYAALSVAHGPVIAAEKTWTDPKADVLPTLYLCTQQATDSDHDGICDDAEVRYGTDPTLQDSDQDALSDTMELYGYPLTGADNNFYDLRSVGADPNHADIFLGVRYTAGSQLNQQAFAPVIQAFEDAPWTNNRDGITGIRLHVLYDARPITGADDVANLTPVWDGFEVLRAKYYGPRPDAFHYALVLWQFDGADSSGLSRDWGAADLVVATGTFDGGTVLQQAGTLMHELGHNLGLHHNGYTDENDLPHYMSVMNYAYQEYGIETTAGTRLDYARIEIGPVDEQHVNENAPFPPAGNTTTDDLATYLNPRVKSLPMEAGVYNTPVMGSLNGPLDLDGSKQIDNDVGIDLNGDGMWDFYPQTRNDWATLRLGGGSKGFVGDGPIGNTTQRTVESSVPFPPCRPAHASGDAAATCPNPDSSSSVPLPDPSSSAATPPTPSSNAPSSQSSVPIMPPLDPSGQKPKTADGPADAKSEPAAHESASKDDPAANPDASSPASSSDDSHPADTPASEPADAHNADPVDAAVSDMPAEEPSEKPADSAASSADGNPEQPEFDGSNPDSDPASRSKDAGL